MRTVWRGASLSLVVLLLLVSGAMGAVDPKTAPRGVGPGTAVHDLPARLPTVELRTALSDAGLAVPNLPAFSPEPALSPALTIIYPNGTISNLSAPIVVHGPIYTVAHNFTGGIEDERNNSVLDGNSSTLTGDLSLNTTVTVFDATNVTVENFVLNRSNYGLMVIGGSHVRVDHNVLRAAYWSFELDATSEVTLSDNDANGSYGSIAVQVSAIAVTGNQFQNSSDYAFLVEYGSEIRYADNDANDSGYGFVAIDAGGLQVDDNQLTDQQFSVYTYSASGLTTSGNDLFATTTPIGLYDTDGILLSHDEGRSGGTGILLSSDTNITIENETLTGYAVASLSSQDSSDLWVGDSNFSGALAVGVFLNFTTNASLDRVLLTEFGTFGFEAANSQLLQLRSVNASGTTQLDSTSFRFVSDSYVSLENCSGNLTGTGLSIDGTGQVSVVQSSFSRGTGFNEEVLIEDSNDITLSNDTVFNASFYGIEAYSDDRVEILHDNVTEAGLLALYLYGCDGVDVEGSLLDRAVSVGVEIGASTDVTLSGNQAGNISDLYGEAFVLYSDTDLRIVNNSATHAPTSLLLEEGDGVQILGNNLSDAALGFELYQSTLVTFVGNQLWYDSVSFELTSDLAVQVYHNNFGNDSAWQLPPSLQQITWDDGYPGGGNFWSNRTGPDVEQGPGQNVTGSDGIVDLPVTLNASNIDRYPLAHPWRAATLTFHETGLAAGTPWSVTVDSVLLASNGSTIVWWPTNGANSSVLYTVSGVPGYQAASPRSGSVLLSGSDATVHISFLPFTYTLNFTETGLAAGTAWAVTVGITVVNSSSVYHALPETNGSYPYSVGKVTGYALTTPSGTAGLTGSGITVPVVYIAIPTGSNGGNNSSGHNNKTGGIGNGGGNGSGGNGSGGGGSGGGTGGKGLTSSGSGSNGYAANVVYVLIAALVVAGVLAALGFALWARARRNPPPAAAQPWTPPGPPPTTTPASLPAGARGAAPAPTVAGGTVPDWSEDPPS